MEESSTPKRKRFFDWQQKEECWKKAPIMLGRDPDRWRLDALGNPVCKFLKGCMGQFCYTYDHIVPFSKGGESEQSNCQLLNTQLNILKSNVMEVSHTNLKSRLSQISYTDDDLDQMERFIFGDVQRKSLD